MKACFTARRARLIATVMVWVWLLGVAMGLANACLLHPEGAGHGYPGSVSVAGVLQHDAHHHDHDAGNGTMSPAALACLSFCTAEQGALVKGKVQCDSLQAVDLAPVHLLGGLTLPRLELDLRAWPVRCSHCPDPPVSIRFLRLTI